MKFDDNWLGGFLVVCNCHTIRVLSQGSKNDIDFFSHKSS